MKSSEFLFKLGATLWLLLAGGGVVILLLQWLNLISVDSVSWRWFAAVFGIGGLLAFMLAGVMAIWDKDKR